MTKAELLELLKDVPMDGLLVQEGSSAGLNDITTIIPMFVKKLEFSWNLDTYEYLGQNFENALLDYGNGKTDPKHVIQAYSIG